MIQSCVEADADADAAAISLTYCDRKKWKIIKVWPEIVRQRINPHFVFAFVDFNSLLILVVFLRFT